MKSFFATLIVFICFFIAVIFSANNNAQVNINYFIAQSEFNISHVIGLSFLTGFVICWSIFYSLYLGLKFKLKLANRKVDKLNKQHTLIESTKKEPVKPNV